MKKALILPLVLAALVLSSCNSKKSQPYVMTFGSLESNGAGGVALIGPEGEQYVRDASSTIAFPTYAELSEQNLDRIRAYFEYQTIEGRESETPIPIALHTFMYIPTLLPAALGTASSDDPLLVFTDFFYPTSIQTTPTIRTSANYLDLGFLTLGYGANKGSEEYATQTYQVEIDPVLVPGPSRDTINMHLKLFANRNASEEISDRVTMVIYQTSVDLKDVTSTFGFPTKDGETDKTYIIKLHYKAYQDAEYPSDEAIVNSFVTTSWTPAKPAWQPQP
jgi:hypothetical protein